MSAEIHHLLAFIRDNAPALAGACCRDAAALKIVRELHEAAMDCQPEIYRRRETADEPVSCCEGRR